MAATNERVMEMVRREIEKDPDVKSGALFEKAKRIDPGVSNLTNRQFHARYPLQVKRFGRPAAKRRGRPAKAAKRGRPAATKGAQQPTQAKRAAPAKKARRGRGPGRPSKRATEGAQTAPAARAGNGRDAVRSILIQFAGEIVSAEAKADVVKVLGRIDSYVDRVIQASS